jgi:hypothetical protein
MKKQKLGLFLIAVLTISFLVVFAQNILIVSGATVFSDEFESGDFSAWTGTSGTPTVQDTIKYQGTYAALSDGNNGYFCYKTGISGLSTAYIRFFTYFSAKPTGSNFFDLLQTFSSSIDVNLRLYSDSFRVSVPGESEYVSSIINPNINTWYCVDLKIESGVGWVLYINNVNEASHSFTVEGTVTTLYIGGWSKLDSSNIYWDGVVLADSQIIDTYNLSLTIIQPQNTFYTTNIIPLNCSLTTNGTSPILTYNIQYENGTWLYVSNQTYTAPTIAILNYNSTATVYFDGSISEGTTATSNVTFTCYYYVSPTSTPSPTPDPNALTPDDAVGIAMGFSVVGIGVCVALIAAKRKKDE